MRRSLIGPLALTGLIGMSWPAQTPALAQTPPPSLPPVTLTLAAQPPWNSAARPLDVSLRATSQSQTALGSLSIALSIWSPARSRSVYELSMRADATNFLFGQTFLLNGSLNPGDTRTFRVRQDLRAVTALSETGLYPVKLVVMSGDTPVAELRTPMIFLGERPEVPLNLAWTWVLSAPIETNPKDEFVADTLERDVAPRGRLDILVRALQLAGHKPVDLALSPVLIDQLQRMVRGYSVVDPGGVVRTVAAGTGGAVDAARVISALRSLTALPSAETTALPYGDPSLPALARAGLLADLPTLLDRGRRIVDDALDVTASTSVSRPPLSQLDQGTLGKLAALGTSVVLVDPGFLPQPPGQCMISPAAVTRIVDPRGTVAAVLPDPGVATTAASNPADPELEAHATLGELAAIWLECPGTPERGVAMMFPEQTSLPPSFFAPFAHLVRASPWLAPVKASRLVSIVQGGPGPALGARTYAQLSASLVADIHTARQALGQFRHAAGAAGGLTEQLQSDLLLSEGGTSLINPAIGEQYAQEVPRAIRATYARIRITSNLFTLTSQSGEIPVTVRNDWSYPIAAQIRFVADRRLVFVEGSSRSVTLPVGSKIFLFRVRAQTTGRFPVKVQVQTSNTPTAQTIAETSMIVRSTAYNRVALFITIGAALFLMAWWGRRFLPRRKS
jgi:hypothetical protein